MGLKFTPEMIAEDEKRWHERDIVNELRYCSNYMPDRNNMRNLDIRFYAYIMRKALELLKLQEPRKPHYTTLQYLVNGVKVSVQHPECPKCFENGKVLWDAEIEKDAPYCKRCGQAIQW